MAATPEQSVFEIPPDEDRESRLDAIADAEIDAGLGVPHEKIRAWLLKLSKGEWTPPPTA
jgi:predicted transcriptional regulator